MSNRFFITDEPVPIYDFEPGSVIDDHGKPVTPNVIWIKARMDFETAGRVKSELLKLGGDGKTLESHLGANQLALLIHNIVRWEGPDLGGMACIPANIRIMPPNDPLLEKVLIAINDRNLARVAPSPNSPTATGSNGNGLIAAGPASEREILDLSANGIHTSSSPSGSSGRRNKPGG